MPIIGPGLWGRVHEILAKDARDRAAGSKVRGRTDALLRGLLYAPGGERMYPTFTRKNGRYNPKLWMGGMREAAYPSA